jgi:MoxR-like ATPase
MNEDGPAKVESVADELAAWLDKVNPDGSHTIEEVEELVATPSEPLVATEWETREDGCRTRQVPFSEKFWPPTHVPDHFVAEFEGYETQEPLGMYVPPKKDFEWISFSFTNAIKPLCVGPTGCGKTLAFEYYAAVCGRPCLRVDNTQELDKAQVFGTVHITDGDTDFVPGDIPQSASEPTIVILDELSRATGGANMIYKRMLDRNEIYLPEMKKAGTKAITPDPEWRVCATDNTKGDGEDMDKYPMSNVQDAAFRNAWGILLEADYLPLAEEATLIKSFTDGKMPNQQVKGLASFSKLVHAGFKKGDISTAFSPRQIQTICQFYNAGIPLDEAIQMAYINFCSKSEMADVQESLRAALGK